MDSFILIGFLKIFLKYVFNPRLPFVSIWHIAINEFESYWLYELTNKKKFTFIIIIIIIITRETNGRKIKNWQNQSLKIAPKTIIHPNLY